MTTTTRELMTERIRRHGNDLLRIFPNTTERDPVQLCKKLRRLESKGQALALRLCNGPAFAPGEDDLIGDDILRRVNALLGNVRKPLVNVFLNRDPRGYALKIASGHGLQIHTDWGGYGIIAPDLS
jgi:hypothetical protein